MAKTVTLLISACALLAGCGIQTPDEVAAKRARQPANHVTVIHDDTHNVTCWEYGGTNGGISCIPDWMLVPSPAKLPTVVPPSKL